jgi:uncharacterized protein (TIGR02246 family)
MTEELQRRLDWVESLEHIRRLAYTYCHGLDRRDIEVFSSVWLPDGEWVLGPEATARGLEQIRELAVGGIWAAFAETHHWSSNLAVDVAGDRATATCDIDVTARDNDGQWFRASAIYNDVYERRDGRWGLARREGDVQFQEPFAAP